MNRIITCFLFAIRFSPVTCQKAQQPGPDNSMPTRDNNVALGNPSNANDDQDNNYLAVRGQLHSGSIATIGLLSG